MTTILADARLGVMVTDSNMSDEDRVWTTRKVRRIKGHLLGFAGEEAAVDPFLTWFKSSMVGKLKHFPVGASVLILNSAGVFMYDANYAHPIKVERGIEAIGTGGKAVMCAYEALSFSDPRRAVRIVCKHDAGSRGPVRLYRL